MPKCSMKIPARRRTKSARSLGSAGAASLLLSLYSETSHQHPSLPIRPFRGVGQKIAVNSRGGRGSRLYCDGCRNRRIIGVGEIKETISGMADYMANHSCVVR